MLQEIAKIEVIKAVELARAKHPQCHIPMPTVEFSNRMTSCGGKCMLTNGKYTVRFSIPVMEMNDITAYCEHVVYHEVAHMVDRIVYGGWGHDASFTRVMRVTLERTVKQSGMYHSFVVPERRKRTRYVWQCKCGHEYQFTSQKHKKFYQRISKPFHPDCGPVNGRVFFTGNTVKI